MNQPNSGIKLKICGVMTVSEIQALEQAGVEYLGLNFVPTSPRCITLEQALTLKKALKSDSVKVVALFCDQPSSLVNEYSAQLAADYVQLHGDESADYARTIEMPLIKAVSVHPEESVHELIGFMSKYPAAYFVLDRHVQGQGAVIDTELVKKAITALPGKVCLAGGLNPENLEDILKKVRPYAIDISSGVRTDHHIDIAKVARCQQIIQLYT